METSYEAKDGTVSLDGADPYHNPNFGYTIFEKIIDPANPEGPPAIAMHLPEQSISKVWRLVEPGYEERVELLSGTASLVINRAGTEDWTTMFLSAEDPTADDVKIVCGDMFCLVTEAEAAVVLSRPSKLFDNSFEVGVTEHPTDVLSRFVLAHVASVK